MINGNKAAKFDNFFYANKFSEEITWGGDIPPREMDSIFVPPDETLIIDKSPPKLYAILVQGNLLFDEEDIDLDAHYIVVSEGRLTIGTEM